ncbi:MAG: hypothetical protein IIT49_03140 [Clostridia bacterium]|nr:hypothetical protein [Clostridia bacterium]
MKKVLIIAVSCLLTLCMLSGCADNTQTPSEEQETVITDNAGGTDLPSLDNYEDSFLDLITYMTEAGIIKGDGTEVNAESIGAAHGKRFTMSSGPVKYYIELFEYEDPTTDKAKSVITNAKRDHTFMLFGNTESITQHTYAVVSENGKYLLLYSDTSTSDSAAQRQKNAESAFLNYCTISK